MSQFLSDKDTVLLILKVRNMIETESHIHYSLSDANLMDKFIEFARQTDNLEIKSSVALLAGISDLNTLNRPQSKSRTTPSVGSRIYRGVEQFINTPQQSELPPEDTEANPRKGHEIIYRGQKMMVYR